MRRRRVGAAAALLIGLLAASVANAQLSVTGGKYSKYQLWSQYTECHGEICPGCLRDWFPDPGNPFDNRNTENCEGFFPLVNWYFYVGSKMAGTDWVHFALVSQRSTVMQTIEACEQRYQVDVQCTVAGDGIEYDVKGAYVVGSELHFYVLNEFIRRDSRGAPAFDDWTNIRIWIENAVDDYSLAMWLPHEQRWGLVFYASLLYWSELTTADPAARAESGAEEEFALTCMAHAFVCWQSDEWENGRAIVDLIGPSGIEDWPFRPAETPDFVYTMWVNLRDLIGIDVSVVDRSWGEVKSIYR